MSKIEHLTDEALTLLAGGQLTGERKKLADEHLRECSRCRLRFSDTQQVHSILVSLSEDGLAHALGTKSHTFPQRATETHFRFPWAPISAITVAALIVIVFFSQPKIIPEASASELLDRALETETNVGAPRAFAFRVGERTCARGKDDSAEIATVNSSACGEAANLIHKSAWGKGNPLSARTFLSWHDGLAQRQDRVIKKKSSWTVDTVTSTGIVREAALTMQLSDYRALSLELRFSNSEEIAIAEDTEPSTLWAASIAPNTAKTLPSSHVDEPSDILEVHAWQILQGLNADSGWEANVIRDGATVVIKANVSSEQRKEKILSAVREYPQLKADVRNYQADPAGVDFLPKRGINADAPALAQAWLQTQFPDSESRNAYTNTTLALSKNVLGRAFILDKLRSRKQSIQRCSCATDLLKVIRHEEDLLRIAQVNLAAALAPLLGVKGNPFGLLSYSRAQQLDETLANLLMASSSETSPSFDQGLKIVVRLLYRADENEARA